MYAIRAPWAVVLICPLLLSQLTACDAPPPSFVENPTESPLDEYSGDAASKPGNSELDPDRNDLNPADRGESDDGPLTPKLQWSFRATELAWGSLSLDIAGGQLEQRFQMDSNISRQTLNFTQVSRPVNTDSFSQGSNQARKQEAFTQNNAPSGLLDILLVVDNSGSMQEEQTNLSSKLMPLLSYVQDSDWQIGVVTTDPSEGCLRGLIRKGDSDVSRLFATAVNAGTSGSGNERGIQQAVAGLKGQCNPGGSWLRNQSTLAVLVVSDEDNCSDGQGCGQEAWAKSDYLLDYLSTQRQVATNARVYGLIWHPSQSQSACRTAYNPAYGYADVIAKSGGTWGSICDGDYTKTLQAISKDLSVILKTQFALQYTPSPGSVRVFLNGQLSSSGYQVRGNVVEFAQAPQAGAQIQIQYDYSVEPPKRSFQLSQTPDPSTLQVYLDGSQTSSYSYEAGDQSINFSQAPNVRDIRVVYRRSGELKREFSIGSSAQAGSLQVRVNQQLLSSSAYSYQAASGLLILQQAPRDQATIDVQFNQELAPRLNYPLYASETQKSQLRVYDAQTGASMAVSIIGDELVFSPQQFRALRAIVVRYPLQGREARIIELPFSYLPASVLVKGSRSGECTAVLVNESQIDMSGCAFVRDEGVNISFEYPKSHQTRFDLGQLDLDLSRYRWSVTVNGKETKDFQIIDNSLDFVSLPYEAVVEVRLLPR